MGRKCYVQALGDHDSRHNFEGNIYRNGTGHMRMARELCLRSAPGESFIHCREPFPIPKIQVISIELSMGVRLLVAATLVLGGIGSSETNSEANNVRTPDGNLGRSEKSQTREMLM